MTNRYLDGLVEPSAIQRHHRAIEVTSWSHVEVAMKEQVFHLELGATPHDGCIRWMLACEQVNLNRRLYITAVQIIIGHVYDQLQQGLL